MRSSRSRQTRGNKMGRFPQTGTGCITRDILVRRAFDLHSAPPFARTRACGCSLCWAPAWRCCCSALHQAGRCWIALGWVSVAFAQRPCSTPATTVCLECAAGFWDAASMPQSELGHERIGRMAPAAPPLPPRTGHNSRSPLAALHPPPPPPPPSPCAAARAAEDDPVPEEEEAGRTWASVADLVSSRNLTSVLEAALEAAGQLEQLSGEAASNRRWEWRGSSGRSERGWLRPAWRSHADARTACDGNALPRLLPATPAARRRPIPRRDCTCAHRRGICCGARVSRHERRGASGGHGAALRAGTGDMSALPLACSRRLCRAILSPVPCHPGLSAVQELLAQVLPYHVIPGQALTAGDLEDGEILQTQLGGQAGELKVGGGQPAACRTSQGEQGGSACVCSMPAQRSRPWRRRLPGAGQGRQDAAAPGDHIGADSQHQERRPGGRQRAGAHREQGTPCCAVLCLAALLPACWTLLRGSLTAPAGLLPNHTDCRC